MDLRLNHFRKLPRKRKVQLIALALAGILSLAFGAYQIWVHTPPPMPDTIDQAMATFQSARFAQLPQTRREAYYDRAAELFQTVEPDQRREMMQQYRGNQAVRDAMRGMMMVTMEQRMTDFATATPADRIKILDQLIDMRQGGGARPGFGRGNRPGGEGRPPRPEGDREARPQGQRREGDRGDGDRPSPGQRIQQRFEHGNPQRQALRAEFMKAMRERMEERGIEPGDMRRGRRGG